MLSRIPRAKTNNDRYMVKEVTEDDFFKRMTSDSENDLMFGDLQNDEYIKQQLENDRRHTMFTTNNDKIDSHNGHNSKFNLLFEYSTLGMNTIDYFNNGTQVWYTTFMMVLGTN
jgi:hypothetical protein